MKKNKMNKTKKFHCQFLDFVFISTKVKKRKKKWNKRCDFDILLSEDQILNVKYFFFFSLAFSRQRRKSSAVKKKNWKKKQENGRWWFSFLSTTLTRCCCDLFHFDFVCSCPHPDGCREENTRKFMWELHTAQYSLRYLLVRGRAQKKTLRLWWISPPFFLCVIIHSFLYCGYYYWMIMKAKSINGAVRYIHVCGRERTLTRRGTQDRNSPIYNKEPLRLTASFAMLIHP